ncbi:hypothetical protein BT93_I0310 [Corymbia citriodora subsp. variegata]|nr:hypothetical protein BT93_I0310 [Corymbia citriodora subsp. variegata]
MGSLMTLLQGLLLFSTIGLAAARGRIYNLDVRRELQLPDSYKKLVITIKGASPGPTIHARQGDIVFVRVTNRLGENVAIRWGGTQEIESLGSDGTEGVAPRSISPGEAFTYRFIIHWLGKSPYHSYYRMKTEDGLRGLIDVLPPYGMEKLFAHDYDTSIVLDDQYYKSNYDWATETESLLISGKGNFDCAESTTPSSHPTACNAINAEYSHWRVVPGKTYRLDISSVTAQSTLSFRIKCHNLTVVEADGHYAEPVQNLVVDSGKTCSVSVKANQDPLKNYSITTNIVGQNATARTPLGLAVLSYSPPAGPIWNYVTPQLVQSLGSKARPEFHMMLAVLYMLA